MAGVLGQFANGPIQFNDDTGAIEPRGTIDNPGASATSAPASPVIPTPSSAPDGGGVLPTGAPTGSAGSGSNALGSDTINRPSNIGGVPSPFSDFHPTFTNPFGGASGTGLGSSSPSNGGSYGASGTGGGGISNSSVTDLGSSSIAFDDGGEVDADADANDGESDGTDPQQGGAASTVDPMQMVKAALTFGRKQFGVPTNFSTGQTDQPGQSTMGFDDGGMIPEQPDQGGQQQNVTAGGNGGATDPRSAMRYLTGDGAVSPEIAGALERHVDPQGQMDPADRTMAAIQAAPTDEAKFGLMQHYRTKFNAYSGGARAALDQGNVGQAAAHATQAFANVPTGMKVKFAPSRGGVAVMASKAGGNPAPAQQEPQQAQSFDDGGEVEDDTTQDAAQYATQDTGVIPDQGDTPEVSPEVSPEGDNAAAPAPAETDDTGQPVVLTPDQFKKLLTAGYDKPLDDGWTGLMNSIMGAVGGAVGPGSAEAAGLPQPGQQHPGDANQGAAQGGVTSVGKSDRQPVSPALQQQMNTPTPLSQVTQAQQKAQTPNDTNDRDAKYKATFERAQKTAAQIYPWASQEAQRSQFVQQQMEHYTDSENKLDLQNSGGKMQQMLMREQGLNSRAADRNSSALERQHLIGQRQEMAILGRSLTSQQRDRTSMLRTILTTVPSAMSDPKVQQQVTQLQQELRASPDQVMSLIRGGVQNNSQSGQQGQPQGQKPQAQQGQQAQQGANQYAAQPGEKRPYTKNGVTKQYEFGSDGMWHLVQ